MAANVIKLLDNVIKRCNLNIALINISSNVGRIDEHRDFSLHTADNVATGKE